MNNSNSNQNETCVYFGENIDTTWNHQHAMQYKIESWCVCVCKCKHKGELVGLWTFI